MSKPFNVDAPNIDAPAIEPPTTDPVQEPFEVQFASRVDRLPPYMFGRINNSLYQKRRAGDDVIEGGPHRLENGVTALPEGPGLGVTLDRTALARCHERYLTEGAFPSGDPTGTYGGAFRKT